VYGGEIDEASAGHLGAGVYAEDCVVLDTGKCDANLDDVRSCCVETVVRATLISLLWLLPVHPISLQPTQCVGPVSNVSPHKLFPVPVNRGWSAAAVRTVPAVSEADDVIAFGHLAHEDQPNSDGT